MTLARETKGKKDTSIALQVTSALIGKKLIELTFQSFCLKSFH